MELEAKSPPQPQVFIWAGYRDEDELAEEIAEAKRKGCQPVLFQWLPPTDR